MLAWLVTGTLGSANVTTVTPSDQAGATSAKRPATIPTQRSVQALRFLVLGTGEDAAAFRARAAEAGAELAQRFSVRVTHVVIEEGVGEDDARVVRARGAGLPVLGLVEGVRLVEETASGAGAETEVAAEVGAQAEARVEDGAVADTADAMSVADVAGAEVGQARVEEGDAADAGTESRGGARTSADTDAGAGTGAELGAGTSRRAGGDDVDGDLMPLIRPRTEVVPAAVDGGPSDAFTGSAFEAMLQFPPLSAEGFESAQGAADVDEVAAGAEAGNVEAADAGTAGAAAASAETVSASAAGVGIAGAELTGRATADDKSSVLMDEMSAACACAEPGEADARTEIGADGAELTAASVGVGVAESDLFEGAEDDRRTAARAAASVGWALVPLVSLGLLTPVAIGYAAYRLRSRNLAAATACYAVATVAALAVSAALPVHARPQSVVGGLMTTCLAAAWLGGTAHSFMLRRRVFGMVK